MKDSFESYLSAGTGVRSMVHTDSIHFISQAVGLAPDVAYWLAAYGEAADEGNTRRVTSTATR